MGYLTEKTQFSICLNPSAVLPPRRGHLPEGIPITSKLTPFALAMPNQYKIPGNAVESYRQYYIHEKKSVWSWKNREKPSWMV
jgi:hypothetical protein